MLTIIIIGFFLITAIYEILIKLGFHRDTAINFAAFLVMISPAIFYIVVVSCPSVLPVR
jgi:hypothetical protein